VSPSGGKSVMWLLQRVESLALAGIKFNFVIDDRFVSAVWLSPSEFTKWLRKTELRYLEVYCRTDQLK
jgi:hypothetical protein